MSTVLIVDDEQPVLRALQRLLHRDGFRILTADSGASALDVLSREEVAVIVCDQRMPQMSGAEVLSEAYRMQPETVRITLTGYADFTSVQHSINDGRVSQLLLKPWDDEHLRTTITDAVRAYEDRQEHKRLQRLVADQKSELESLNAELECRIEARTADLHRRFVELTQVRRTLEQTLCDTVTVLAETLEAHSPNLGIHSKRVAELASRIALRLGLEPSELKDVEFAARLHELGRIAGERGGGAPAGATKASVAEIGHGIVARVAGFERVAQAILHQENRYDDRAARGAVPRASRIIAVANTYDDVSYHIDKPTTVRHRAACEALRQARGNLLDPEIVDATLAMFAEDEKRAPVQSEVQMSPLNVREGMVLSRPIQTGAGVLLLKEGSELTEDMIEHIRSLRMSDALLDGVWVYGTSDAGEETTSGVAPAQRPPTSGAPAVRATTTTNKEGSQRAIPAVAPAQSMAPSSVVVFDITTDSAAGGKRRREVLVVDDSMMICNALRRELRMAGIDVCVANTGESALRLVKTHSFDAAVVDLMMPEMSGRELVRALQDCAAGLKCVILTGNATKSAVIQSAKEPNVAAFVTKPWTTERLIAAIDKAIEGRAA